MKIKDMFEKKEHLISFEIFPPNKNFPKGKLKNVTAELVECNPDFISVTYGAGGKTKDDARYVPAPPAVHAPPLLGGAPARPGADS